jgi:hypothetical protein
MLKLSHGYLKTYLNRIGKANSNGCWCGTLETTEHLLLSCPEYSNARPTCLKGNPPLSTVFREKESRISVLQFIREIRIATRRWYLARGDEGTQGNTLRGQATFFLTFLEHVVSLFSFVKLLLPSSKDKKNKQENKVAASLAVRLT